jgi:hypothetical protein
MVRFSIGLLLICVTPLFSQINPMNGTGLQTSVAVDTVFKQGKAGSGKSDLAQVRGAELMFFAPVDQYFDGVLTLAAHPESTGSNFEIHEAYIQSTKLIPRTKFRLGKFFMAVGRLNSVHRHDWPFISAPKVHETFFDSEAANDTGAEVNVLLPTPFFWSVTMGLTNGWTFGHSHGIGEKPEVPVHYVRSSHYFDVSKQGGVQLGLNYMGRTDSAGTSFSYLGIDSVAKWRQGQVYKWMIQSEAWMRIQSPRLGESETMLGAYVFPRYGISQTLSFGVRGDFFTNTSLEDFKGRHVSNATIAFVPTLTWQASEFSRFSVSYTHEIYDPGAAKTQTRNAIEFLTTFIIGAHPAHLF